MKKLLFYALVGFAFANTAKANEKENDKKEDNYAVLLSDESVDSYLVIAPCVGRFEYLDPVTYQVKYIVHMTEDVATEDDCFGWIDRQTMVMNDMNPTFLVVGSGYFDK